MKHFLWLFEVLGKNNNLCKKTPNFKKNYVQKK